jgi:hypothetical protein
MCAPFDLVSSPRAWPICSTRLVFQVDARAIPTGKQAEVTLPPTKPPAPRAPLGPSLTLIAGTPSRSTGVVYHIDAPASSDTFSATVMSRSSASTRASESVRAALSAEVVVLFSLGEDISVLLYSAVRSAPGPALRRAPPSR